MLEIDLKLTLTLLWASLIGLWIFGLFPKVTKQTKELVYNEMKESKFFWVRLYAPLYRKEPIFIYRFVVLIFGLNALLSIYVLTMAKITIEYRIFWGFLLLLLNLAFQIAAIRLFRIVSGRNSDRFKRIWVGPNYILFKEISNYYYYFIMTVMICLHLIMMMRILM